MCTACARPSHLRFHTGLRKVHPWLTGAKNLRITLFDLPGRLEHISGPKFRMRTLMGHLNLPLSCGPTHPSGLNSVTEHFISDKAIYSPAGMRAALLSAWGQKDKAGPPTSPPRPASVTVEQLLRVRRRRTPGQQLSLTHGAKTYNAQRFRGSKSAMLPRESGARRMPRFKI